MENKTSTTLRDEIFYKIATSTGYIENKYPLMESCNTLTNYYYRSHRRFNRYFANKIYNRINWGNKIANWEDIYNEELTLFQEDCFKYKNIIQQCLKWDGKLTLLIILSLCMVMISIILIVWMKSPIGNILFILSTVLMLISIFPHYYAKRLIKRESIIANFVDLTADKEVVEPIKLDTSNSLKQVLTPLLYTLHILEDKKYITAVEKESFLYRLYSRYKVTGLENQSTKIEAKEFFVLLTTLISSGRTEGKKVKDQKNRIAIFNLECPHKDLYNLVYEIFNKENSSANSYKTELSKGLNRNLSQCINDLYATDKKHNALLLQRLLNKNN